MLIKIYSDNPNTKKIAKVVNCLKEGGVIIYPTDTVYAIGCDVYNKKAMQKLCRIKGLNLKKHNLSFICYDLRHIADFTKQLATPIYKLMKKNLPGPYTFILEANNSIPKLFKNSKKEIGIRIPDNNITRNIVKELGNPIVTTSIKNNDKIIEYFTNPTLIHESLGKNVDIIIDGGYGGVVPSTIIDCTNNSPKIIREGKGEITQFL
tara:strand:+ start:674 stop:1294 length:621 start_codon:yes stop_codon:yes gene_type:complete